MNTPLDFGKHYGLTPAQILQSDQGEEYLMFLHERTDYRLGKDVLAAINEYQEECKPKARFGKTKRPPEYEQEIAMVKEHYRKAKEAAEKNPDLYKKKPLGQRLKENLFGNDKTTEQ